MKLAIAITLAALLAGCGSHGLTSAESRTASALTAAARAAHGLGVAGGQTLIIEPDMGTTPIIGAIANAKKSIHMEMYLIMPGGVDQTVLDALCAKAKSGVNVSVILDASTDDYPVAPSCQPPANPTKVNQPAFDALTAAGAHPKWASRNFRFTHQKSMVIDGTTAYILTLNFSSSAFTKNREYGVIDQVPTDVAEAENIFASDWNDTAYSPNDPGLAVSPTTSRSRILGLIDSAQKSLVFEVEFASDRQFMQHLAARVAAGVSVTAMLSYQAPDPCSTYDPNASETKTLTGIGVKNIEFPQKLTIHAKAILVDGTSAYVGSENFTSNSLDNNREMGVITRDLNVIQPLARTLTSDWTAGTPRAAEAMTLADLFDAAADFDRLANN